MVEADGTVYVRFMGQILNELPLNFSETRSQNLLFSKNLDFLEKIVFAPMTVSKYYTCILYV